MKKFLLILSLLALALAACSKQEEKTDAPKLVKNQEVKDINQFEYKASDNVSVSVSEFANEFSEECIVVQANYMYDDSKASISCVPRRNEKMVDNKNKNEVVKQFVYKSGNTPVQVTMIKTRRENTCTIVHINYMLFKSTASVHCS
jgi:catabolite regulation protein CreA